MKTWAYCWRDRKPVRRTGMVWKRGVLQYSRHPGPITYLHHILNENLKMMYLSQVRFLPDLPLLTDRKTGLPTFEGGNTLQFFTYSIKESA